MDIKSQHHHNADPSYNDSPSRKGKSKKPFYKKRHLIGLVIAIIISGTTLGTTYVELPEYGRELSQEEKRLVGKWDRIKEDGEKVDFKEGEYFRIMFNEDGRGNIVHRQYEEDEDTFSKETYDITWKVEDEDKNLLSISGYEAFHYELTDKNTLKFKDPDNPDSSVYKRIE